MNTLSEDKLIIINAFEVNHEESWKSINELASLTGIDQNQISNILLSSNDFVQSTRMIKNGEPLFTTKGSFRSGASFISKMLGAFKNRID